MEILGLYYIGICTCFTQFVWTSLWLLPIVHTAKRVNRPQNDHIADWQLPQTSDYCRSHNWFTPRQRKLCELHPSLLPSVMEGAMEAIKECRYQFKNHRWNCPVSNVTAVFGRSKLRTKNPEMALLQSVTSAGVTFTVTRACGSGEIIECGCDNRIESNLETEGGTEWEWGGCSDDIRFGMYFSRDFVDASEEGDETGSSMMTLHNYEAGRKAIEETMEVKCKCHGVSGSCTSKVCWNSMTKFRFVGDRIFSRYQQAYHMRYSKKRKQLRPIQERSVKPTTSDLVYLRSSPDYCEPNKRHGSLGTHGRFCTDNCSQMCCGRGYQTMERRVTESCNCRFHWCCEVECETCNKVRELRVCN